MPLPNKWSLVDQMVLSDKHWPMELVVDRFKGVGMVSFD